MCDQLWVLSKSVALFRVGGIGQLADLLLTLQSSRLIAQEQESQGKTSTEGEIPES
jgi:hypothetical protein